MHATGPRPQLLPATSQVVRAPDGHVVALSVVTSLYNSAPHLAEFLRRAHAAAAAITSDYEIVLVNDGSPDASLALALDALRLDPRLVVVDLSRNFGHHRALMTGLAHARGERIFLVDSDLEEAPELLAVLDASYTAETCDVVYGVQDARKGSWFERVSGRIFYALFNRLSAAPAPPNALTARLLSRRYVDALLHHREQVVWIDGLFTLTGFRQVGVTVEKGHKGRSAYRLGHKLALSVDAITNFSDKPLHFIFWTGIVISIVSMGYIATLLVRKMLFDISVDGWTSLVVSIWMLGGLTILFLGIIGIYLSKVFIETKQRPLSIVRAVHRHEP
jgi:putative glycosyltransferase